MLLLHALHGLKKLKGDAMESQANVFEKYYIDYLKQLESLDFDAIALKLGGQVSKNVQGKCLRVSLLGQSYDISHRGITDLSGKKPMYDICIILCRYLLMCSGILPHGRQWVAFRDLRDSGPLTVYFRDNVERAIARVFAGKTDQLKQGMAVLNGYPPDLDVRYDLAMQVDGLPKIPMVLLFNDADESFPPECSILFEQQVETYLDAECIAMLGYRLASRLKHFKDK